jgi:hypothetical protein
VNARDRQIDLPTALVALAIAAIAALAVWQARAFSAFGSIFPLVTGTALLLASLAVFARGVTGRAPVKARFVHGGAGLQKRLALIAVLLIWAFTLEWAGFAISSWVCFVGLALIADNRRPTLRRSALFAAVGLVVVFGLQFLFGQLLSVRLP